MNYYTGKHIAELDTKGRVVIPKAFRKVPPEILDSDLFLSPNPAEKCIEVYPELVWEERIKRIRNAENLEVGEAEELVGSMYGNADRTRIDGYNRLAFSHALRDELGVDGAAENITLTFEGWGENFRIYVAADYERERKARRSRVQELTAKWKSGPNRPVSSERHERER